MLPYGSLPTHLALGRSAMLGPRLLVVLAALVAPTFAAFGLTESGNSWIVDTDGGLVFTG